MKHRLYAIVSRAVPARSHQPALKLRIKQERDAALWKMNRDYVEQKMDELKEDDTEKWADLQGRIEKAEQMIEWVSSQNYLDQLQGTLGADWVHREKA